MKNVNNEKAVVRTLVHLLETMIENDLLGITIEQVRDGTIEIDKSAKGFLFMNIELQKAD